MADLSPDKIIEPRSEDQPCGPDLDMEDMDFMNFMAELDGKMPTRYFSFDPGSLNFQEIYERIDGFLDKALDVRLLIPLAKLKILQGDIDGFVEALEATHAVLKAHWTDVHPAGDFIDLRTALLATFDDNPNVILPLQHATLFRSRRSGPITLRRWQLANGDVSPREDEEIIDGGTLMNEISAADAEAMKAIIAKMERGRDAINGIRTVCISEGDFDSAPTYDRLPQAFDAIIEMIKKGTGADGDSADDGEGAGEDGDDTDGATSASGVVVHLPTGDVRTREDAIDALYAAEKYYALYEPSSPNVLLLREARAAANKTFAELVSELLPESSGSAFFVLGKEPWFEVSLNEINSRNPAPDYDDDGEEDSDGSWEDAGLDDGPTSNDEPEDGAGTSGSDGESNDTPDDASNDAPEEASAESTEDESAEDESAEDESAAGDDGWTTGSDDQPEETSEESGDDGWTTGSEEQPEESVEDSGEDSAEDADDGWTTGSDGEADDAEAAQEPEAAGAEDSADAATDDDTEGAADSGAKLKFEARTRPEALALIEKVRAYYRVAEPSSPVALMLDRAVELATKNFIGLLREVLPDGHLKVRGDPSGGNNDSSGW